MIVTSNKQRFYEAFATVASLLLTWGVAAVVVGFYVWAHI